MKPHAHDLYIEHKQQKYSVLFQELYGRTYMTWTGL